jgi:CubicO group peptidase (beta-lactamase class C family)
MITLMDESLQVVVDAQVGRHVPGLALVAATPNQIVLSESWGLADISSRVAMEPHTTCNWFSMTKLVTATVAVQLEERGILDLDAPVERYYEPFGCTTPSTRSQVASVRHLLSHSSGLANPIPLRWVHLATEPTPNRASMVQRLIEKHSRLRFDPGTKASYSNLGYLVLGEVIEAASGQDFETFVHQNVLAPLGMGHTGFAADPGQRWATPYQQRRTALDLMLPVLVPRKLIGANYGRFRSLNHFYLDGAAYGGLVGPPDEALRFLRAHLRDGELDGTRLMSESSARAMRTIAARGKKIEVGLGWFRRGRNPRRDFVEHLGGGAGFWNCMRLYPERDIGLVIMGNATSYDHDSIAQTAVSRLLN